MSYLQALLLSIVEGVTEFLPVSSTGHLVLAAKVLGISQTGFVKSFEISIQAGAVLAVIFLYLRTLRNLKIWSRVIIAFIPTGILGFALYKIVKEIFLGNTWVTLGGLVVGGLILIITELRHQDREDKLNGIENISLGRSFLIGLFQSFSMIPGVSRSGATIVGGLILGLEKKTAVEFSFLLAAPTIMAAAAFDILKSNLKFSSQEAVVLGIGIIGSFVTAFITMKFFIRFVKKHNLAVFGLYRIALVPIFYLLFLR